MRSRASAQPRARFRTELVAWSLLAVPLGAADGGVVGVMHKNLFADSVGASALNFSIALILGAPHFCNLLGFVWPKLAHGRDVATLLFRAQIATALCLLILAVAPVGGTGLLVMVGGAIGARLFWSGVVTLRAPIWRAEYPARVRARLTGVFFSVHSVVMALTALAVSSLFDWSRSVYPATFAVAAAIGVSGAVVFRRLAPEVVEPTLREDAAPAAWRSLPNDRAFARYLFWLSALHMGNLMLIGPLIVIMTDRLELVPRSQILVTSVIPLVLLPFAVPVWALLFDNGRVLRFQMLNAVAFALAALAFLTGTVAVQVAWLWIGAVLLGFAYAGGSIGFHLGQNSFAPRSRTLEYMGVHVTLSGIRGLVAPLLGMAIHQAIEALAPGYGVWALLAPLLLCAIAACGFARLASVEALHPRSPSEETAVLSSKETAGRLEWLAVVIAAAGVLAVAQPTYGAEHAREPAVATSPAPAQGYLVFCLCSGRFGNQVDLLLGAMAVARASGRTLVLPPFVEYHSGGLEARFVPFDTYFSVAAVREYVPAVTMEEFMTDSALAATQWPAAQRRLYCPRGAADGGCRMPTGNPRAPFWKHFGVTFAGSAAVDATAETLSSALPAAQHPVVALNDSPGRYPVTGPNRDLQRHLRWSDAVRAKGEAFLGEHITRPFVAVHLRNGVDWQQACRKGEGLRQFLSSPQCGLSKAAAEPMPAITQAVCLPGPDEVVRTLRLAQQKLGPFRTVFIGTDSDDHSAQIQAAMGEDVRVVRGDTPQLDLYVFGQADLLIGNCVSSFTAFAVRDRLVHGQESLFFGRAPFADDAPN